MCSQEWILPRLPRLPSHRHTKRHHGKHWSSLGERQALDVTRLGSISIWFTFHTELVTRKKKKGMSTRNWEEEVVPSTLSGSRVSIDPSLPVLANTMFQGDCKGKVAKTMKWSTGEYYQWRLRVNRDQWRGTSILFFAIKTNHSLWFVVPGKETYTNK